MLHVCIGTKAQYIKMAPLIRLMDAEGLEYRLVDIGQHGRFSLDLRRELAIREPDVHIGGSRDITTIPQALKWATSVLKHTFSRKRLQRYVFGGRGGIVVIHGDTPSTLLSAWLARRAGLSIAHIEAGLRSWSMMHPFPEEIIRILVMRISHLLFAPSPEAAQNLDAMGLAGRTVQIAGNTSADALKYVLSTASRQSGALITCHRVENIRSRRRMELFVETIRQVAREYEVTLVLHPPTREALSRFKLLQKLPPSVTIRGLVPHESFVALLVSSEIAITDGGSIQEECALIGIPTLLWRSRTERPDGLGHNVVLSRFQPSVVQEFLSDPERYRRSPAKLNDLQPSAVILKELKAQLSAPSHA